MNSMVGVRMNTNGAKSATRASRQAAAAQSASTYLAKVRAALKKAGYAVDQAVSAKSAAAKSASTTAASATGAKSGASSANSARTIDNELGKDTFLRLMVLQMQNQDPLAPMDNAQMIAQLAQFSALEQMNNLNESFTTLGGNVEQLSFLTANGMLGRTVTGADADGNAIQGKVDKVVLDHGAVYVMVGGVKVPVSNITDVADAASSTSK